MASSDAYANAVLLREVSRGGSVYFRLLDAVPPDDLSSFSLATEIPYVAIALNGVTSWTVGSRQANPNSALTLNTAGVTVDVVPLAWCLFGDSACTLPLLSGRLADIKVTPGSTVSVPAATVTIRYPASAADLL